MVLLACKLASLAARKSRCLCGSCCEDGADIRLLRRIGTSLWNATGWWNAYGSGNHFQPYAGSCQMQGLGYDSHEIQLVNSPSALAASALACPGG